MSTKDFQQNCSDLSPCHRLLKTNTKLTNSSIRFRPPPHIQLKGLHISTNRTHSSVAGNLPRSAISLIEVQLRAPHLERESVRDGGWERGRESREEVWGRESREGSA
jgi:hypothetical protein